MVSSACSTARDLTRLIPGGYDPWATAGDCWFDDDAAQRAIDFYPAFLHHYESPFAGQPFVLAPWQAAIEANVYGWKRPDGTRRYREVYETVGRKNGKTTRAAGRAIKGIVADGEKGAQVYSAAAEREQAAIVYRAARAMVEMDATLSSRLRCLQNRIVDERTRNRYTAISSEAHTKHGLNPTNVIVDELHAIKDRELVDVLLTGTCSRRQPLVTYITTAGFDRLSICYEKYDYACKVRDGLINDAAFLPVIYEVPADADWHDEEVWRLANPNLGVTVSLDYLRREYQKAIDLPSYENTFRRLHLNQWTEQDVRWLQIDKWDACRCDPWDDERLLRCRCDGGLDLGATRDLTAFVLVFRDGDHYFAKPYFWLPEESLRERVSRDRVPYDVWVRDGVIKTTPGWTVDYQQVRRDVVALCRHYGLCELAIDRLFQGAQLMDELTEQDGLTTVEHGQGFMSMAAPTRYLEEMILAGQFHHDGNPVLRWMAGNVAVETDAAGNIKPSKKKSTERIDGIVAAIMALSRAMVHGPAAEVGAMWL